MNKESTLIYWMSESKGTQSEIYVQLGNKTNKQKNPTHKLST